MRRVRLISVLAIWFIVTPAAILAACPKGVYNDLICSGYGSCNPLGQCVCDENHFGFDCSQATCPRGLAWVAPARATDDAHYEVECSNRGECDRQTGSCQCMFGYTGSACQRMACANECSDGGQCLSLRQLSQVYAVATEPLYDYAWDSNMIHGCLCSSGYHGYDCSKTSCPRGDDPLTTGQANEMQIIRCTGTGGFFHLFFNGVGTRVPWDATEDQFNEILRKLQGLPRVKATYTAGPRACSDTLVNAITVEFTQRFGPQPPFKVFNRLNSVLALQGGQVFAAAGGVVLAGKVSVKGSKEWAVCSNRGDCDEVTGICSCYLLPMPGFRSSDGYGNPGLRGDCGCANGNNKYGGPIKACPGELACSGHGYCMGSPSFKCVCERGWATGDCSERTCPQGPAWFTAPSTTNTIHNQWMECSNAGICEKTTGQCQCYSPFTGEACNFLKCPGEPVCSGHGECMSIRQLSQSADVDDPALRFDYGVDPNNALTYDRDSVLGCKCDPGYQGYDCNQRQCPRGDDPTTDGQVDEIKVLRCIATGGSFQLQYRLLTSGDIPFDASPSVLRGILMSTLGFEEVVVEYSSGTTACSSATASVLNVIKLTFPLDFGNLPAMRVVSTNLISNAVAPALPLAVANNGVVLGGIASRIGTKESIVCSNKGYCDYEKGACVCTPGYASSDGYGNVGNRGDCGYRLAKAPQRTLYYLDLQPCAYVFPTRPSEAMATDNATVKASPLSRRFSADISVLSPTRSAGNLIASAGAESASKARQLRHASYAPNVSFFADDIKTDSWWWTCNRTFNLRYIDPDTSDNSLGNLLRRHLLTQENGASDFQLMADAKSHKHSPPPPKKLSAKMERALQLRDQCERDLTKFCETKRNAPRGSSPASSPCRAELLDKSYWFNPEHVHDNHGRDKNAFDRLMRKLSPAMKNAATTHVDLVHMLQACGECALRATFCPRCAKRASEFFENYTIPELQALYCRELPPPDAKALDKFAEAMAEREYRAIH